MRHIHFLHAAFAASVLLLSTVLNAQNARPSEFIQRMVDPTIDDAGPFSYPSHSTDQLSVMGSPSGAEITPEGYVATGFGELMFFVGAERVSVSQRLRTLKSGYLPVFSYDVDHDGLRYTFTLFAASLDADQEGQNVINFIRVTIHNSGAKQQHGFLTTSWRYQADQTTTFATADNRFRRLVTGKRPGDYQQPGDPFNATSAYAVKDNAFLRDGKVIYGFSSSPQPQLTPSYRDYYNRNGNIAKPAEVLPTTPMATAEWDIAIPSGESRSIDLKVPLLPAAPGSLGAIASASFDEHEVELERFWATIFARGIEITTPEAKVNDTYRTSLVNNLVSLNKVGNDTIQTINQLQYHGFYLRDSADFVRMYDTSNYSDIGGRVVDFFASRQQADGNFLSQPGQFDGWGQALWTYGEHYRITHDRAFANAVYPRIQHAVEWFEKATAEDPLHLMPSTDVRDNEYVPGHLTGYNFLALDGLQAAERLAHDTGHIDDEKHYKILEGAFRKNFLAQLDKVTAQTGGYIPPALDGNSGGTDWGNLLSVVPEQQLNPADPRVTATLRFTQARYQEGLIVYRQPDQGVYLHDYLMIKNSLTELIRGEQEQVVRDLYAELIHTSSTHGGWEYAVRPWGDRDFSGNLAPHGWFAAEYRNLLRNMMIREEGQTLHLLSAVSPEWIGSGKKLSVSRAKTYFGTVDLSLDQPTDETATLQVNPSFDKGYAPEKIVLHLPWFMRVGSIETEGKILRARNDAVELTPAAHTVHLHWTKQPLPADMPASYADAVTRYKHEYRRRYNDLLQDGSSGN
jgi:hypothetical protein